MQGTDEDGRGVHVQTRDWRERRVSASEAVSVLRPGERVFIGSACGTPRTLIDALERWDERPAGVVLVHFLTDRVGRGEPPSSRYRHRVFYVGADVRALIGSAPLDYVPLSLAEIPKLLESGRLEIDVAMVQVAPPDADGQCSLGVSVDVTRAAALAARRIVAEVNEAMPRTRGESSIPAERIERFVEVDAPVTEYVHPPAHGVGEQIARYVARLVDDRSTLQIGLGRVPNQMLAYLTNRRDLAIHSDVITEPVADLVEAGVVTRPVVGSWAMGTRRLYDLLDDSPRFELRPIEQVCDPRVIAGHPRMVSVTQAFRIDLTGQVCMESLDGELYGGVSTGPDFHRGALASPGGKAIVCLASRTPGGRPAICPELESGEAVGIARADVHWVITEYGTAYLFGRSLAERAVALMEIAHPDDRAELLAAAVERRLVSRRQQLRSRSAYPVGEERDVRLRDGREVRVRPTRTGDTGAMQALFHRLSEDDVRTRFFQHLKSLTDTAAQHLCSVDYDGEMAFAAVTGPLEHERIVGTSSYYLDPASGLADVGYMVDPEWQGSGLGAALHARMIEYARVRGVRGFRADVIATNRAMLRVFRRAGHPLALGPIDEGAHEVTMEFAAPTG
jgi:acyl-CoA hydrolase/RimJ/RimL family protein N-acetyltransferase